MKKQIRRVLHSAKFDGSIRTFMAFAFQKAVGLFPDGFFFFSENVLP